VGPSKDRDSACWDSTRLSAGGGAAVSSPTACSPACQEAGPSGLAVSCKLPDSAAEWGLGEETAACSCDALGTDTRAFSKLNDVLPGMGPSETMRTRPWVTASTTWGDHGRDFRLSFWRRFWNHIWGDGS
jgi:hypothetical protein